MLKLSPTAPTAIALALSALLVVTRDHHFSTANELLPSASWAVFFLAGVYLRPAWALAALLGLAACVDFTAIQWQHVSDFCMSPAYVALLPAYGTLWAAGRWYASGQPLQRLAPARLAAAAFAGAVACELISTGSFYFFSGRFAEPTVAGFGARLAQYAPHEIASVAFWVAAAALLHAGTLRRQHRAVAGELSEPVALNP